MPIILGKFAYEMFTRYTATKYFTSLKWILFEIRIPKNPNRSPKATEQIYTALHGIYTGPVKDKERILKGKVPDWFSFEIISTQGEIHFFVRTLEQYRSLVQSQIYAQYPDAELHESEDYVTNLPVRLPDDKYDLFGAEFGLTKEDAYPIRTYEEFEEKSVGKDEVKRIDPLASLSELFASLHADEHMWLQMLIRPTDSEWMKRAQATIEKLQGKAPKAPPPGFFDNLLKGLGDVLFGASAPAPKEEKKPEMAPGAGEAIRAIERSMSRLGHETTLRWVYIAPKETFHRAHTAGMVGVFKQFSTQNLNGFNLNKNTITHVGKGLFKKKNTFKRKVSLYNHYKGRVFSKKPFVFNTDELATVFHFPDSAVRTPLLPRVEAKKGEPPSGLPMV